MAGAAIAGAAGAVAPINHESSNANRHLKGSPEWHQQQAAPRRHAQTWRMVLSTECLLGLAASASLSGRAVPSDLSCRQPVVGSGCSHFAAIRRHCFFGDATYRTTACGTVAWRVWAPRLSSFRDRIPQSITLEKRMLPRSIIIDPVCGMTVTKGQAPFARKHDGSTHYLCSSHGLAKFESDADAYSATAKPRPTRLGTNTSSRKRYAAVSRRYRDRLADE